MATFQPGQVWTYHTRPGEEASRLLVFKVDDDLVRGSIVHVYLNRVAVKSPHVRSGIVDAVAHLPLTQLALEQSVIEMIATGMALPPYEEAYAEWREQFDNGEAGAWPMTVAECLGELEKSLHSI